MTRFRPLIWITLLLGVALFLTSLSDAQDAKSARIMGPNRPSTCIQCHEAEVRAWEKTHHFASIDVLGESDDVDGILENLGLDDDPTEIALCQGCHVTMFSEKAGEELSPEWGVSCESCHGAAEHWMEVHQKLAGGAKASKDEPPKLKMERLSKCEKLGMIPPSTSIYRIALNCFGCHTVPQEKLVNVGGHAAGSKEFELVAWSQGEVRHNFVGGKKNPPASPERARVLFVVGHVVDLEQSVRALSKATADGGFAKAMNERIKNALATLGKIKAAAPGAGIDAVLGAVQSDALKPGNGAALTAMADAIRSQGMKLAAANGDAKGLDGVDALLPKEFKGAPSGG